MRLSTQSPMDTRKCIIYLPDHRKLDLSVTGKQLGKDLWESVIRELHLKEDHYFGLKYKTSLDHYAWIQEDKKVLDHDIEMKSTDFPLEFVFSVRCYEDSVTVHKYPSTVELIFLHAQNLMYNGEIHVPSDLSLELTAYSLQAFYGDFINEETASSNFKKLSCLPRSVIQEFPSIKYCEEQVISWYKNLSQISRGQAVLAYMSKVEKLPDYGVHYFKVKDKARVPLLLGICNKGIFQFPCDDKRVSNLRFLWRNLKNLYFREKKFSVEVCSGHKRALSTGSTGAASEKAKKDSNNLQPAKTHSWYGSPSLIKSIWLMAIAQHQFYWHKKQSSRSKSQMNKTNASNLRNALDKNPTSLVVPPAEPQSVTMQRKANRKNPPSTPSSLKKDHHTAATEEPQTPEVKALEQKMITDLKKRKTDLEDQLYDKVQQLKAICQEELNLTERIPIEYLRYILPWEDKPVPVKKIGASFPVQLRHNNNRVHHNDPALASELQKLESDCELLTQITKAAYKLAYDPSSRGRTKRKRLQSYQKSLKKLQEMENRIDELRKKQGRDVAFRQSTLIMTSDMDILNAMKECSMDDKSERSSLSEGMLLGDDTSLSSGAEALSTHSTPALSLRPSSRSADIDMEDMPIQRSRTPPPSRSTKVAWLATPKVKLPKDNQLSPNDSYPVLHSPIGYRSTTSHTPGIDAPPNFAGYSEWPLRWEAPRRRNPAWKESSLDSLESIESRKSSELISGNPAKRRGEPNIPNANALRIARATESRSKKSNGRERNKGHDPTNHLTTPVLEIVRDTVQDDRNDSRTSLTDSGHGTDSRVPSCYEEDTLRRKKDGMSGMRKDMSDSSLSESSTQSNPPHSSIPKFVPYFMTKSRGATQNGPTAPSDSGKHNHARKRSSSLTESESTLERPSSETGNFRTLTQSRKQYESDASATDLTFTESSQLNGDIAAQEMGGNVKQHQLLTTSQSANALLTPKFDTNLNIQRQYLSRSQGQLAQQNNSNNNNQSAKDPVPQGAADASSLQYVSVVDKSHHAYPNQSNYQRFPLSTNNSNNKKLNFGQIYKLSQVRETPIATGHQYPNHERSQAPQDVEMSNNVPKCNSLDSILDSRGIRTSGNSYAEDTPRNYMQPEQRKATPPLQYPQYYGPHRNSVRGSATPDVASSEQKMTERDRDMYNNEAFNEIRGMGWVPSLDEYGSRASVAESLPAKSKRQDIRELLQQRMADWKPRRTPSAPNAIAMKNKKDRQQVQARIKEMLRRQEPQSHSASSYHHEADEATWEDYKNKRLQTQGAVKNVSKADQAISVNIFAHNPPPLQHQNQRNYSKNPDTANAYSQGTIPKVYVNRNEYTHMNRAASEEHRHEITSRHNILPAQAKNMQQYQQAGQQYYKSSSQVHQQNQSRGKRQYDRDRDSAKDASESEDGAKVVQATRTSPNGHKVSVFTVTKSAPNTPLPSKNAEGEKSNPFFKANTLERKRAKDSIKSVSKDQLSPTSDTSEQSDFLQALAIEAARDAQVSLTSSQGSLDQFAVPKDPPPLPAVPPNSNLRSSMRGRRVENDYRNTPTKRVGRPPEVGSSRAETATPTSKRSNMPETRTPRSRSKTRRDNRDSSVGRSGSPAITTGESNNALALPVRDMRSGAKTPNLSQRSQSPTQLTPNFQRTLSTPIRVKPVALQPNGSPKINKSTGMYNEPMMAAKLRPPTAPRVTASTPTPTRSTKISSTAADSRQLVTPTYQMGQGGGTLPRTPKSHKRLERSGSTSGAVYQANRIARPSTQPSGETRQQAGQSYVSYPRKEKYNAFLGNEELKYKRSLSETWKQPPGTMGQVMPQQHQHHHYQPQQQHSTVTPDQHYLHHSHMYQIPLGHHQSMSHDHPRRTASADDLLWQPMDGRDSNKKLRSQQGTLV